MSPMLVHINLKIFIIEISTKLGKGTKQQESSMELRAYPNNFILLEESQSKTRLHFTRLQKMILHVEFWINITKKIHD